MNLIELIEAREARIVVIGLGRVGLTIASVLANTGFQVLGIDINKDVVNVVKRGTTYIKEPLLGSLIRKVVRKGNLTATNNIEELDKPDVIIVSVQTPITENKEPNLTYLVQACRTVAKKLSKETLVIIQSTMPPGTTKNQVVKILEEGSGLRCGEDFWLAHCPERLRSGRAVYEFVNNLRLVGGYDLESTKLATQLFNAVVLKGKVVGTDCTSAEMSKLAENTFRDVNIAFANELALICEQIGIDVANVINLANTHPRVNIHKPGCVGGSCLPKDSYLLLHSAKKKSFKSRVIKPCRELNDEICTRKKNIVVK